MTCGMIAYECVCPGGPTLGDAPPVGGGGGTGGYGGGEVSPVDQKDGTYGGDQRAPSGGYGGGPSETPVSGYGRAS